MTDLSTARRDPRPVTEQVLDLLSAEVGEALKRRGWTLATAESCTGGWIAQCVTATPGSSGWFDRAMVAYSNAAKISMLGVPEMLILDHGAVSQPVVQAMARGALVHSTADITVAVSGVAGPAGGSDAKPVGTVWIAFSGVGGPERAEGFWYAGDRWAIRAQAVRDALSGLLARATGKAA